MTEDNKRHASRKVSKYGTATCGTACVVVWEIGKREVGDNAFISVYLLPDCLGEGREFKVFVAKLLHSKLCETGVVRVADWLHPSSIQMLRTHFNRVCWARNGMEILLWLVWFCFRIFFTVLSYAYFSLMWCVLLSYFLLPCDGVF